AHLRVLAAAVAVRAAAEHLRPRFQLDVDLEPDDGLQLIGPQFSENRLFEVGHALERALGFDPVPERLR
ncbi:MAG TPA: hypothetical protein VNT23_03510, partial [Gaiellaceae bacterium]|nr:hypothetical protein [Gaiellaceae bacterium]